MHAADTRVLIVATSLMILASPESAHSQLPTVPSGFGIVVVTDSLPAPTFGIAVAPAEFGSHAGDVFLAAPGGQQVIRVRAGGDFLPFMSNVFTPTNLAFAPAGSFGAALYVSCNQKQDNPEVGALWRVEANGTSTLFGSQTPEPLPAYRFGAGGVAFSESGPFGTHLYTGASGGNLGDCISRLGPGGGSATLFNTLDEGVPGPSSGAPFGIQFGNGSDGFGDDLFFAYDKVNGPGLAGGVYRLTSSGERTAFASLGRPAEIEFGPGGEFGRDLFVVDREGRVVRIDGTGTVSDFVTGIPGGSFGLAFADSTTLYFNSVDDGGKGRLYRVFPLSLVAVPTAGSRSGIRLRGTPNPCVGKLVLTWEGSLSSQAATCTIYSASGRFIREVHADNGYAGASSATWDARDCHGTPAPSGVYFAALRAGDDLAVFRFVLLARGVSM